MNNSNEIIKFAAGKQSFSRKELLKNFSNLSEKSLSQQLYRLVKSNRLERKINFRLPIFAFGAAMC